MSFYTGTQAEVLFSNPSAYPAEGASSTAAVLLLTGASGAYQQPLFPGGFWQQGRQNQVVHGLMSGVISGESSATTATVILGLATANNTASTETLGSFPALTITSFASGPFWLEFTVQARNVGYGTSATSTSLETSGAFWAAGNSTSIFSLLAPTNINTVDFSVNQWFAPTVTMSTNNAGNSMTVQSCVIWGDN